MRLEYLFSVSREGKFGSKLIANTTGKLCPHLEPCSHVSVKIGPLIVESTLTSGVRIQPLKTFIKHNKVVHAFRCPQDRRAVKVLEDLFKCFWGKKYDYPGILYFAWRMLGFLILKRPLPAKNRWQKEHRYFCVEIIEATTGYKYHMTSPIQLVDCWKRQKMDEINPDKYNMQQEQQ